MAALVPAFLAGAALVLARPQHSLPAETRREELVRWKVCSSMRFDISRGTSLERWISKEMHFTIFLRFSSAFIIMDYCGIKDDSICAGCPTRYSVDEYREINHEREPNRRVKFRPREALFLRERATAAYLFVTLTGR